MADVIDSLVTQLEYTADTKVIAKAEKQLKILEKQSEQTARATDILTNEQIKLAEKLRNTAINEQKLRSEQSKLRKEIKQSKQPTDEQKKALAVVENRLELSAAATRRYRNELSLLGIQQAKLSRQQRTTGRAQTRLGGVTGRAQGRVKASAAEAKAAKEAEGFLGLAAAAGPVGAALTGIAAAATVAGVAIGTVVETGARMETLRARLKTVEGGVDQATAAFSLLRDFAKSTPFELEDVTNAYVRLKSLGIQPTEESLKAFGNVAAAQGKPIIDFIEAVADASTGEFERLKEFGIKASSQGEQVAFTFGGITTRVGKNAKEITNFLQGLGETSFAGAMADQMDTFNGLVSNLKDTWTSFLDQIAQLGVLDEAKAIIQELSGTMGDDLAPIIADVMIGLLRELRDVFVFVRDSGGGLSTSLESLAQILEFLGFALQPVIVLWEAMVAVLQFFINVIGVVLGLFNNLMDAIGRLLAPLKDMTSQWEGLGAAWDSASEYGGKLLGFVDGVTASLFSQAEAVATVRGELVDLQKQIGEDVSKLTDAQLNELRIAGGEAGVKAEAEQRKRIKAREESDKREERAQKADAARAKKTERAGEVAQRFDKLTDRQLAAFAADPNVSKKLRDKAEKEQDKRDKKKKTKGAAAAKKLGGATLIADINKQIDKNARELAQAETARGLRSGKIGAGEAGAFETRRFKEIGAQQRTAFETTGRLPAGIAQDVRQIAALPSINDLAGRVAPPVISNTINNYTFTGNEFQSIVEGGTFSGSPSSFAALSLAEHRKMAMRLLGESVPNFRTQEIR